MIGKRLFRRWICHPLRSAADIVDRQQSIEDLKLLPDLRGIHFAYNRWYTFLYADHLSRALKEAPDLERLIARVHVGSCKLTLFLDLLDAFDKIFEVVRSAQQFIEQIQSSR